MKTCVWIDIDWSTAPSRGSVEMAMWLQTIGHDFATTDARFVKCTKLVFVDLEVVKVIDFPILIVDVLVDSGSLVDALIAPEDVPLLEVLVDWVPRHPDWRASRASLMPRVPKVRFAGRHRGQAVFASEW